MRTGLTIPRPDAMAHCLIWVINSAFVAFPSIAKGVVASFPSHFTDMVSQSHNKYGIKHNSPSSLAQLPTKLDGHAITHF